MKIAPPGEFVGELSAPPDGPTSKGPAPADPGTIIVGDPEHARYYEVEMDASAIAKVANRLTELGYANGRRGDNGLAATPDDPIIQKDWSYGADGRIPKGIYELGTAEYAPVGYLTTNSWTGVCTATLIGGGQSNYYIITAAHCFWDSNGNYIWPHFQPRRDSCQRADLSQIPGCNAMPYGDWVGSTWMMYTYFVANCINAVTDPGLLCAANDIAIEQVYPPSGQPDPGSYSFSYMGTATTLPNYSYLPGYPNCNNPGQDPVTNCRSATLYRDVDWCYAPASGNADSQGWRRIFSHRCDTSHGMSGSPFLVYNPWPTWWLLGVHVGGLSPGCYSGCTNGLPNHMRRITPEWYGFMLNFMGF